jgi:hypothetical protein
MEISQSQSLFDTSDMSDLEIDIYSDAIFSIIKSSCTDENYLESLSSDEIIQLLSYINDSIEFFLEMEYIDYVEHMIESRIKLEKIINNIQE